MRAIVIAEQGASPTLTELPTPEPGAGEVRVRVRVEASSLNGFDSTDLPWLNVSNPHLPW
jgi:NADPH:quinone reductase-like Zn-dependent oxidoreductase